MEKWHIFLMAAMVLASAAIVGMDQMKAVEAQTLNSAFVPFEVVDDRTGGTTLMTGRFVFEVN